MLVCSRRRLVNIVRAKLGEAADELAPLVGGGVNLRKVSLLLLPSIVHFLLLISHPLTLFPFHYPFAQDSIAHARHVRHGQQGRAPHFEAHRGSRQGRTGRGGVAGAARGRAACAGRRVLQSHTLPAGAGIQPAPQALAAAEVRWLRRTFEEGELLYICFIPWLLLFSACSLTHNCLFVFFACCI